MDINIRNCQIATIPTKTHNIIVASKEDLPNTEKVINDFFSKFEIIKIVPLIASKELIKSVQAEPRTTQNIVSIKPSVLNQYLQLKESLKDTFTAQIYCDALKTIGIELKVQSVYYSLNKLIKLGKLTVNKHTSPMTYNKIHIEPEPMPNMVKERKNLSDSYRT